MLSDLLALCETVVPDNDVIDNLDLVVASRTIDGQLQTSISNINQEIIKSLPVALEVDLTTKGMVDLIGKHIKVSMDYANNSWGLVCADFLANLNYHNKKENEKTFLNELAEKGKYSLFESFGSFEIRRANISERDQDFVLALYRWILIDYQKLDSDKSKIAIQRLLFKIFNSRGTSGATISFEALIERLWRGYNQSDKYTELAEILGLLESALLEYNKNNLSKNHTNFLFRLRNLMLIVDNHLARTAHASEIAINQNKELEKLASNPEYFQMILDFKITEIENYVNSLEFVTALNLATNYSQLIKNYREVWQLLVEKNDLSQFERSRAYIKAEMALLRCNVLCIGLDDYSLPNGFIEKFGDIKKLLTHPIDKSRLDNYKIMLLLKQCKPIEAINCFTEKMNEDVGGRLNEFDILWYLKAINDALLTKTNINMDHIIKSVALQISFIDINKTGHPIDLILRELALFEFQLNNKSKALKYIKRSKNLHSLDDSEISSWLKEVVNIYEDYINGKLKDQSMYFQELKSNEVVRSVCLSEIHSSFIEKVRFYSPY